ncbi:MAG: adenylate/guanylate cyclase domain-containing protein [Rhodospirillaceae bacterium]
MDDAANVKQILRVLDTAVATVDRETHEVLFENARFFQWFPPPGDPDAPIGARIEGFSMERALQRIGQGRRYTFEAEAKSGSRTVVVAIEVRELEAENADAATASPVLVVEGRDISKQKESEYMLESYSQMAEKNARDLTKEKERVEKLLLNIMPRSVYTELSEYGTTTPQRFDDATVLMLDFVGFTNMAISRDPGALVAELNDIFSAFDRIVELFGCERIKTIGDAYMAVSGLPDANPEHAVNIAKVALRMRRYIERRNESNPNRWLCRIGIASGPVVGSMVGIQKYVYDIFGPGVNLAARLEGLCEPMQILINEGTRHQLTDDFVISEGEDTAIKGFETQTIYVLERERPRGGR